MLYFNFNGLLHFFLLYLTVNVYALPILTNLKFNIIMFLLWVIAQYWLCYTCFLLEIGISDVTLLPFTFWKENTISVCYIHFLESEFYYWIVQLFRIMKITIKAIIMLHIFSGRSMKMSNFKCPIFGYFCHIDITHQDLQVSRWQGT